jgi:outer membrane protein assembly factor BamB
MKLMWFQSCLVVLVVTATIDAADWPQWRGPNRNDISTETGLLSSWEKTKPKLMWKNDQLGRGYSGPSIVGDRVYISGSRDDKKEFLFCLNIKTGKELWSTEVADFFDNGWGGGPRSNPTVADGLVYVLGPSGDLICIDASSGEKKWSKNLVKDLSGKLMSGWGYSESPLVDGELLLCTPGGNKGTLAALNRKTGDVVWRSKNLTDSAGYASIIAAKICGIRQYVTLTANAVIGVDAKDGKLLWREVNNAYRTAVIPSPIVSGDFVYATSGYGAGCDLVKVTKDEEGKIKSEKVYSNKNMVNHHGGVVLVNDHIYGFSDGKGWVCQDLKTGKNLWEEKSANATKGLGKGSVTYADGRLYCYGEREGTLVLAEASPDGWKEHGRMELPQKTSLKRKAGLIWTHPVVANGKLFIRDLDLLFCFDISAIH